MGLDPYYDYDNGGFWVATAIGWSFFMFGAAWGHVREIVAASVTAGAQVCILDPESAATRDEEFRRIEHERRNSPVAITDVVPPIRAGIIDSGSGGMRLPELAVETGDGRLEKLHG